MAPPAANCSLEISVGGELEGRLGQHQSPPKVRAWLRSPPDAPKSGLSAITLAVEFLVVVAVAEETAGTGHRLRPRANWGTFGVAVAVELVSGACHLIGTLSLFPADPGLFLEVLEVDAEGATSVTRGR